MSWRSRSIARQLKSSPAELAAIAANEIEQPVADNRIGRELGALALLAVGAFATVSLVSLHLGQNSNLGGPVGGAIAGGLAWLFGYDAYPVIALLLMFGLRIWSGVTWKDLAREVGSGAVVVVALAAALGLWKPGEVAIAGVIGAQIADVLRASLNIGGGFLAVGFVAICAIALMLKRAPTDLASAAARKLRPSIPSRAEAAIELADEIDPQAEPGLPDANGMQVPRPSGPIPLKVRRIEPRDTSRDKKDKNDSKSRNRGGFKLPPLSLLDIPPAEHAQIDEVALERSARLLEQKLGDFGVDGRVVEVQPGPVVTMYKFEPGSGIKVSQIVNLADDLSMALRAASVRIQAPVPNEAVVGIEVPNRKRENDLPARNSRIGRIRWRAKPAVDCARQGYCGSSDGSGPRQNAASVDCGRDRHRQIGFAAHHDSVGAVQRDRRRRALHHDRSEDAGAFDVREYSASAGPGGRRSRQGRVGAAMGDPGNGNALRDDARPRRAQHRWLQPRAQLGSPVVELKPANQISDGVEPPLDGIDAPPKIEHRKLPKIVIIIDELADLLLSEGKTVERDITRLAQKARASGIHLILATQRPSVDVITGLIKANLPARISLQVTSRVDSRTILDSIGAERLLGAGDMLFMPPGSAKLIRLHGPFVSEIETRKLADFSARKAPPITEWRSSSPSRRARTAARITSATRTTTKR